MAHSHALTPPMKRLFWKTLGVASAVSIVAAYCFEAYNKRLIARRDDWYLQVSKGNIVRTSNPIAGPPLIIEVPDLKKFQEDSAKYQTDLKTFDERKKLNEERRKQEELAAQAATEKASAAKESEEVAATVVTTSEPEHEEKH